MALNKTLKVGDSKNGMDAKKILKRVAGSKKTYSFTVDGTLMDKFKKIVGPSKASAVIEELIKEFLDSLEKEKK